MSPEAKKTRAAYQREWRKKNKDKVKKNNARYWEKKAKEASEQSGECCTN